MRNASVSVSHSAIFVSKRLMRKCFNLWHYRFSYLNVSLDYPYHVDNTINNRPSPDHDHGFTLDQTTPHRDTDGVYISGMLCWLFEFALSFEFACLFTMPCAIKLRFCRMASSCDAYNLAVNGLLFKRFLWLASATSHNHQKHCRPPPILLCAF